MTSLRQEVEFRNPIRKKKINELLLPIMRDHGIDMWLILTREVNPDPMSLDIGADHVGYRGVFFFIDTGDKLKKIAISAVTREIERSGIYDQVHSYYKEGLTPHLRKIVHSYKPKTIGVNMSKDIPFADGLTAAMKAYLETAIGPEFSKRIVSAEHVAATFRARRIPEEIELFRKSAQITEKILAEALTPEVIIPVKTTEEDLIKFIESKMYEYNVLPCFEGACPTLQTSPFGVHPIWSKKKIINPGDQIHVDFGILYMGYSSDLQRNAYVLRPGGSTPPEEIQDLFELASQGRKLLLQEMRPGKKAHDVHLAVLDFFKDMKEIIPWVVPHTLDTHYCHGAGPYIDPDYPDRYGRRVHLHLEENQCFAVELILEKQSTEQKRTLIVGLEDDGVLRNEGIEWLNPPQTKLIVI